MLLVFVKNGNIDCGELLEIIALKMLDLESIFANKL